MHPVHHALRDLFIPHQGNAHKPKILHHHALTAIALVLIFIKIAVSLGFFFIYPNRAQMSVELTDQILNLTNIERRENNLKDLTLNPELTKAAELKARDMLENGYFDHQSPDGKWPWDLIDRDTYPYIFAGENLAMYFSSAQSAHQALMMSPSHRKNILAEKYTEIGLAVVNGVMDNKPTNILVQIFGARYEPTATLIARPNTLQLPPSEINEPPAETEEITDETEVLNASITPTEPPAKKFARYEPTPVPKPMPDPNILNNQTIRMEVPAQQDSGLLGLLTKASKMSRNFFISMLIFMFLALGLNIFVRVEIQHKPVILHTVLVIFLLIGFISVRFHFLETIFEQVAIL